MAARPCPSPGGDALDLRRGRRPVLNRTAATGPAGWFSHPPAHLAFAKAVTSASKRALRTASSARTTTPHRSVSLGYHRRHCNLVGTRLRVSCVERQNDPVRDARSTPPSQSRTRTASSNVAHSLTLHHFIITKWCKVLLPPPSPQHDLPPIPPGIDEPRCTQPGSARPELRAGATIRPTRRQPDIRPDSGNRASCTNPPRRA